MKYFSKRLDTVKLSLMRCGIFLQAMNELLAENLYLWWIVALTNVCEHDETSASETYARHAGRQSTADCHKAVEDDERERTRSGGMASEVSSEKDYNGVRVNKYTARSETLYFNQFYAMRFDNLVGYGNGQSVKHIYLGDTRIVTKLNTVRSGTWSEEVKKQYFYHSDHLGSASLISDSDGKEYQRIEYTPYGETWVEMVDPNGFANLPYKFTGKERDEETGLYYFGARYLDPQYSRWLSTDPALGDFISGNSRSGGVYNHINLNLYHYSNNNPINYTDPDGREQNAVQEKITSFLGNKAEKSEKFSSFVKEHTNLEVKRGKKAKTDDNDTTRIKFLGISLAKFTTQSEKNYRTENQSQAERFDDDVSADAITLPKGDYMATLLEETKSYNKPLSITSDKIINGRKLTRDRGFLFHGLSTKTKTYDHSMGHGCQILPDYLDCRNNLESLGFKDGDLLKCKIR